MNIGRLVLCLTVALVAFVVAGFAHIACVLKPQLLPLLYLFVLVVLGVIVHLLLVQGGRRRLMGPFVTGLIFGAVVSAASGVIEKDMERFDSRRAAIEKAFMEFQARGCVTINTNSPTLAIHVMKFGSSTNHHALVVSRATGRDVARFVSDASFLDAERSAAYHGLSWVFDRLKKNVAVWSIRSATCVRAGEGTDQESGTPPV